MGRSSSTSSSGFWWPELDFSFDMSYFRWPESLNSRWMPEFNFSYITSSWLPQSFHWWPDLDFSIVDSVVWTVITVVESLVLVSMLCFFFVCCGCTI